MAIYLVRLNMNTSITIPKISDETRRLTVKKINAGMKQRKVARLLEISHSTVSCIWNKYISTRAVDDRKRSGRPMISTEINRRELCRYSKKNPFATAREVHRAVDSLKIASISTIKNYLRQCRLLEW